MPSRPRLGAAVVTWLLAVGVAGPALAEAPQLVERVLAVVGRQIVFSSEVRLVQALRGVSADTAREALVDELLMYQEASRLRREPVPAAALDAALESLTERLDAALARDVAAIRRLAKRQLVILRYIEFRFRPLITASDEEVAAERARRDTATLEAARELVERRRLDARVEQWVADLRSGARIRYAELGTGGELNGSQP